MRARRPSSLKLGACRAENLVADQALEMERVLDLLRRGAAAAAMRRLEVALNVPGQTLRLCAVGGGAQ